MNDIILSWSADIALTVLASFSGTQKEGLLFLFFFQAPGNETKNSVPFSLRLCHAAK